MPKLRHLALHTANVEATADFYKQVFDMKEVGRNKGNYADAIYLTDGTLNLTVLTFNSPDIAERIGGSKSFGVVHFGFWVDDLMEIRRRLKDLGAECVESHEVKDTQSGHFEDKWKGPDGTLFDVTNTGFPGALPPQREQT
jgi:catechol 2,3-dioxygenase-like lactoylglutathione lyase family enzyme